MVSAIGVFSMHSASLVDRATGFNRQNVQATAIVEFGMRGAATWLGCLRSTNQQLAGSLEPAWRGAGLGLWQHHRRLW